MGAGYVRLANGIYDEDGNNDEDDESAVDNDEEDELDAELEKLRTIKTLSFCTYICYVGVCDTAHFEYHVSPQLSCSIYDTISRYP